MENNPMVSFVIPVHNASNTIEKAVSSIFFNYRQDDRIEIIIVENDSTDDTTAKCEKLEAENSNIHLYHSKKGVSNARNMGIKCASSKWISFIDADDYLLPDCVERIVEDAVLETADLVLYNYESGNERVLLNTNEQIFEDNRVDDIRERMLKNPTKFMTVWAKLFKKDIMINNNVVFNSNLRLAEDGDFIINFSNYCERIAISKNFVYHYTANGDSVMHNFDGQKTNDYIKSLEISKQAFSNEKEPLKRAYNFYIMMHFNLLMVHEVFATENELKKLKKMKLLKETSQISIFKNALMKIKLSECRSARMLPILFIKLHCYFFAACVYKLRIWQNQKKDSSEKD